MICCSVNPFSPFSDTLVKRLSFKSSFSGKKLFLFLYSAEKILIFSRKMPLKCSNNAQCVCLTKMLGKMLA